MHNRLHLTLGLPVACVWKQAQWLLFRRLQQRSRVPVRLRRPHPAS